MISLARAHLILCLPRPSHTTVEVFIYIHIYIFIFIFLYILAQLYSICLSRSIVPHIITIGIIVPIIKKTSLDPNQPDKYRPIALSSVHSKLLEKVMVPEDNTSDTQFGF